MPSYIFHTPDQYAHPFGIYKFEKLRGYRQFGIINYWLYSAYSSRPLDEAETTRCDKFMDEYFNHRATEPLIANDGRNLIVLLVESFQTWPIDLRIDDVEITPNLNVMVADSATLFYPHVLPQVGSGRSSDAQLLINTGMLPVRDGATASLYGTNEYASLPKALSRLGYHSSSFLCDNRAYWNQGATTISYGFDGLYDKLGYIDGHSAAYRADQYLYDRVIDILTNQSEPFYAQIVTFSGHDIVDTDIENPVVDLNIDDKYIKNALTLYSYEDEQIGKFLQTLKDSGLYDRSIIVITGDHDFVTYNKYEHRDQVELTDRFVPLIILNSPIKPERTDIVIGQSDIYPSLLDVMGFDYPWRGLGESIFRSPSGFAVYKDGTVCGDAPSEEAVKQKQSLWEMSDLIIRSNYFQRHNTLEN